VRLREASDDSSATDASFLHAARNPSESVLEHVHSGRMPERARGLGEGTIGFMTTSTTKSADTAAQAVFSEASSAGTQATSAAPLSLREGERAALRPAVARVESDVARLEAVHDLQGYAQAAGQLASSWQSLVSLMALGTAPELRTCPHCGYRIFVQATRCMQCWQYSDAA
jgi:hypothetical protein